MTDLRIARNLTFPLDAVTQTFGCIGRKGSGKTYLAGVLAEQMLDRDAQIIIIDPVGNWYGLRVAADGKAPGKEIFIIGGEHGDVPILPDAGARIAKLLVEKHVSAILDISSFRQGERKRFAADFAEEFFHLKKTQKSAVHLFVEEAQLFAPQRVEKGSERMLGAYENIIRLGRNYGIGATMISQRPQSINKEVLSQVECLMVLQVNGVHERNALDAWVQEAGADRSLVNELPGLAQGEGYIWSPSWLRIFARYHFNSKTTFDASATPKVGQTKKAAKLTPMDVEALREDLQQVIEKAQADDPNRLRGQIATLKSQLALASVSLEASVSRKPETVDRKALLEAQQAELDRVVTANREHFQNVFGKRIDECMAVLQKFRATIDNEKWSPPSLSRDGVKAIKAAIVRTEYDFSKGERGKHAQAPPPAKTLPKPSSSNNGSRHGQPMSKAARSILTVLAQRGPSLKTTVAAYAGYAVSGGGFNNSLSQCRSKEWVTGSDVLEITPEGTTALGPFEPLPTGVDLLNHWMGKVGKAERMILSVLAAHPRVDITKDFLAGECGYAATGGGFNNALSRLRKLELIEGSGIIHLKNEFAEAIA